MIVPVDLAGTIDGEIDVLLVWLVELAAGLWQLQLDRVGEQGAVIMNTMSSTSMTSIIGIMLISERG